MQIITSNQNQNCVCCGCNSFIYKILGDKIVRSSNKKETTPSPKTSLPKPKPQIFSVKKDEKNEAFTVKKKTYVGISNWFKSLTSGDRKFVAASNLANRQTTIHLDIGITHEIIYQKKNRS